MQFATMADRPGLEVILAVIARSPIAVAGPARQTAILPDGFDEIDAAVLNWIAAEGLRIGRSFARM